ncbi:uracil-DNA glycosylase family protein [Hoeflea prorocentri]|uniref:Uracil-DNA glycosylase family protein n=1 Tax=Hoeflea prorocentri TaxID=1922333 RepID=A0A9X3UK29_9HYPH|nr:uracil-DNA glycosylase family protein [Hoeflea prorocentri]MCY6380271.1 uracil-DNA glycosylase family protein [Hoeflea prorocentri]MDA5398071.1 uracil-DNA glycosylase family protein [Hoeflea prorocentri]
MASLSLETLLQDIRACRVCRDMPRYGAALPHEPRPVCVASGTARVLIAGQAPGTRVHESGIPFNDPSGDRLRGWMDVDRETFYDGGRIAIVPMGFCFPGLDAKGGDLPPRKECRELWHDRVIGALPDIRLALVIGQYAHAYHLGPHREKTLTATVLNWRAMRSAVPGFVTYALPHPSWRNNIWLKKNPWFESELLPALRADLVSILES